MPHPERYRPVGNRNLLYFLQSFVFKLHLNTQQHAPGRRTRPLKPRGEPKLGGPVACLPTDELQTMLAANAQLEDTNTTLREMLTHLAGNLSRASQHMIRLRREREDLEQQLEQERSATDEIVNITWTAAQESDRRKLGLLPAPPQQKTGPRHRRGKNLRSVNAILIAVVLSLSVFRPLIHAKSAVHRPAATAAARRRTAAPLPVSAHGLPRWAAVSVTG